jgi:cilia- and flagella-associated protein 57
VAEGRSLRLAVWLLRQVLSYAELGSKEVTSVCFSMDGKTVLTQGGAPDWTLVLWNIEKTVKVSSWPPHYM